MAAVVSPVPDDVEALKALLRTAVRQAEDAIRRANEAEAELAAAKARASATEALIAHLKLQIARLKREQYGSSAERSRRLLDQLELELEELEARASEDELAAERAAAKTTNVAAFSRKRPAKKPFPEHLPRERVVIPAPCACPACGSARLSKLGEDVTETLEVVPRQWKVLPDRSGEVLVPGLRGDHPTASPVPCRGRYIERAQIYAKRREGVRGLAAAAAVGAGRAR
jgi:multidrug efflux pump subunit AcrA (membrane-fusion protein)